MARDRSARGGGGDRHCRIADQRAEDERRFADARAEDDRRYSDKRAELERGFADRRAEADRAAARELRAIEMQPYVVVSLEQAPDNPELMFLVLRNYGRTAANEVAVIIDPAPTRPEAGGGEQPLDVPSVIGTLAPGQEWRTFWRTARDRKEDVPTKYSAGVTYVDWRGEQLHTDSIMDFDAHPGQMWHDGLHDIAQTRRKMETRARRRQGRETGPGRNARALDGSEDEGGERDVSTPAGG